MPLAAFRNTLINLFGLREEEIDKTLRLQGTIFILLTVLLIVKPTITSLFLNELTSDALPLGYVLTAIFAVSGSILYNKLLESNDLNKVIEQTIVMSILSLIVFGLLLKTLAVGMVVYYIMYVWVAIFGLLTASQFWILANLTYNIREAKRVFGFIGAGAIAGAIFGGYLTSLLANYFDTENFLFLAAAVLTPAIYLIRKTWKKDIGPLNTYQRSARQVRESKTSYQLIRKSPLLTHIAIVVGFSVIVAKLVDYQYSDYASRLISDQDELTSFFGFWLSSLSIVSLLIQLFLTKRIVGAFGVGSSLLWLPTGILLGSALLLIIPELWVVVLIKIVDGSLKQSVNKSATELLSIPVPLEIKKKTKTFIDVVIDSIATGIAGLILIFFINALDIPPRAVSFIIMALIVVWLFFIYRLRNQYIAAFKTVMENEDLRRIPRTEKKTVPVSSIITSINRVFSNGSNSQIIHMLNRTIEAPEERFFHSIKTLLNHPSARVRHLALENLYYLKSEIITDQVNKLLYDSDQQVITSAFKYLIKHQLHETLKNIDHYTDHSSPSIRNAALVGLAQELRNNHRLKEKFKLSHRVDIARSQLFQEKPAENQIQRVNAVIQAIGYGKLTDHYDLLKEYIYSSNQELVQTALISAAHTLDPRFIRHIASTLDRKDLRDCALQSLVQYGEPVVDALLELVKKEVLTIEQARYVPRLLEEFTTPSSISALLLLARTTEHLIKIEALSSLKRIKQQHPKTKINERALIESILDECALYENTLSVLHSQILVQYKTNIELHQSEREARNALIKLLESRLDRPLERIFNFLGLKYPPDDVTPVYDVLVAGKKEERLHAIEFLDNILDPKLKRELLPIVESYTLDPTTEEMIKQLNIVPLTDVQCFSLLLQRPDNKLKIAVLYLIQQIQDIKYQELVESCLNSSNKNVRESATKTMESLKKISAG
ncbi:MAG: hypothetical protein DHS20C17_23760 [Cyclobacteriaceae bacterium]|nr:MAG: hypothetical protein DHS20C17_23760 [Cyclobacteriaceae bacterium]